MSLRRTRLTHAAAKYGSARVATWSRISVLALAVLTSSLAWSVPKTMEERKAVVFDRLIQEAEKALVEGRLTTPEDNNALDKLRAAGMVRPDDPRVRAGLQAIEDTYEKLIDEALQGGDLEQAGTLLQRLLRIAPKHARAADFRQLIAEARAARPDQTSAPDAQGRVWLSPAALRARGEPITAVLQELAQEVQRGNWSIHIYARTDEEGRWIYKTLKEAVPGYRIRGDIRISATPYVQLMDPLT